MELVNRLLGAKIAHLLGGIVYYVSLIIDLQGKQHIVLQVENQLPLSDVDESIYF